MSQYDRLSIWESKPNSMSWYDHLVGRKCPADPFITPHMKIEDDVEEEIVCSLEDSKVLGYQGEWYSKLMSGDANSQFGREQHNTSGLPIDPVLINKSTGLLRQTPYFEYLFADAEFETTSGDSDNSIADLSVSKSSCNKDTPSNAMHEEHGYHNEVWSCEDFDSVTPQSGTELNTSLPSSNCKLLGQKPGSELSDAPWLQHGRPSSPELEFESLNSYSSPRWQHEPLTPESVSAEPQTLLDGSALGHCPVHQDGMTIAPRTIIDSHLATVSTNLETNYSEAHQKYHQDQQVSLGFFETSQDVESPMSLRILNVAQTSTSFLPNFDSSGTRQQGRPKLQPKSQRAKLSKNFLGLEIKIPATYTSKSTFNTNTDSIEIVKVARKRAAEDTITYGAADIIDDEVEYICTKKARFVVGDSKTEVEFAEPPPSVIDLTGLSDSTDVRQSYYDFFNHKGLAIAPKGYAGQFNGMIIDRHGVANFRYNLSDEELGKLKGGHSVNFGDGLHPNGIFSHSAFSMDPWYYTSDLSREHLPSGHPLRTCMHYANDMTIAAAHPNVVKLRNHDEEILRREAHIECASARLEGVTVGYYRYYQGFLSLAEYNNADMCVCWEPCACTKMCTRFGDLKCPCAKHIIVHGD